MAKKKDDAMVVVSEGETAMAAFDYGDEAGEGYEGQTTEDTKIPFILILQSGSKPCKDEENYPNARPGRLFNTASEEIFTELLFVPCLTEHTYDEWKPRDSGGGFVGKHEIHSALVKQAKATQPFGKYTTPEGNDLVETFKIYGATYDEESGEPTGAVVIGFTSTKIKPYKSWNTKTRGFQINANGRKQTPPIFAHTVRLTTILEKRSKGDSFNFVLKPANGTIAASLLPVGDPRLEAARSFKALIQSGDMQADTSKSGAGSSDGGDEEFAEF